MNRLTAHVKGWEAAEQARELRAAIDEVAREWFEIAEAYYEPGRPGVSMKARELGRRGPPAKGLLDALAAQGPSSGRGRGT